VEKMIAGILCCDKKDEASLFRLVWHPFS